MPNEIRVFPGGYRMGAETKMKTRFKSRLALVIVVALTAAFVAPAFATAQTLEPTQGQYDDTLTQISQGANPPSGDEPSGALDENVGPLPFTGFDVLAMAAVALAVAGLGLALQRAVSRSPQQ